MAVHETDQRGAGINLGVWTSVQESSTKDADAYICYRTRLK